MAVRAGVAAPPIRRLFLAQAASAAELTALLADEDAVLAGTDLAHHEATAGGPLRCAERAGIRFR